MLKGGRGGQAGGGLELLHQLIAVESVHEVDVAGAAVENGDRQIRAVLHIDPGRLLVGIAAVFQGKFVHMRFLLQQCLLMMTSWDSPESRFT